ncbi:zona pellucida sperm-binding protein 4-like isoform X2 [Engraulis encrasicolus]|uniref:zona pellucida sperm-binding protein 4-like isoform X2 n=1 Tax=Engraulis encrasicolus TaxID=184585 RepID=UPI002FD0535F
MADGISSSHGPVMSKPLRFELFILIFVALHDKDQFSEGLGTKDLNQNGEIAEVNLGLPAGLLSSIQPMLLSEQQSVGYCDKEGFHIVIQRNATVPLLELDKVHVAYNRSAACKPTFRSKQSVVFQFPITGCGAKFKFFGGYISYWVNIVGGIQVYHLEHGSIFRDPPFIFTLQCTYILHGTTTLKTAVQKPIVQPPTMRNEGLLRVGMRFAKDASYNLFHKKSDSTKYMLGDPVFVDVFLLKLDDEALVLCLRDCWATPTSDSQHHSRWNLLSDGCPSDEDSYNTEVLQVTRGEAVKYPQHHKWFMFRMFSFGKSNEFQSKVFIHCNAEVCKGTKCCVPNCSLAPAHQKTKGEEYGLNMDFHDRPTTISEGPLLLG